MLCGSELGMLGTHLIAEVCAHGLLTDTATKLVILVGWEMTAEPVKNIELGRRKQGGFHQGAQNTHRGCAFMGM
jgi:hypothetical protein